VPAPTLRIFSDLHFLEGTCRVKALSQLHPLLDGADQIIFNGDTIDTQNADPDHSVTRELKATFAAHAPTTFITGNHDPDISDIHALSLADGNVWLTHGDVFFDALTPWSHNLPEIQRRLRKAWSNVPVNEHAQLDARLRVFRQVCLGLPRDHDPRESGHRSMLMRYWFLLYPPRCTLSLLHTWATMSGRAAGFAAHHRPKAKFIIFGHTHRRGIWRLRDGRVVINTGTFSSPLTAQTVELQGNELRVHPIILRGGEFHLDPPTKTFALPAPALSPLTAKP
jgi:predicted phosphodiesterase